MLMMRRPVSVQSRALFSNSPSSQAPHVAPTSQRHPGPHRPSKHIKPSPITRIQMSERGNFRGGGRGGGRGRGGGDRGGRGGGAGGAGGKDGGERKKENILDLNKYMDKAMTVKFNGGREGEFVNY